MKDHPLVTSRQDLTHAAVPALFLLLWSSGFIAAKIGLALVVAPERTTRATAP